MRPHLQACVVFLVFTEWWRESAKPSPSQWNTAHLHGRPKALSPGPGETFKSHAIEAAHTHEAQADGGDRGADSVIMSECESVSTPILA